MVKKEELVAEQRIFSWQKILVALVITIIVFSLGLVIGTLITSSKVSDVLSLEKEARFQLESLELEEKLLEDMPCASPSLLLENLEDLSKKLTYLESEYDKGDSRIIELKKPYTLLQIRHYLKMKEMVESCGREYAIFLFFYSNSPEYKQISEEQGFVLSYLQRKYTVERVKVYSFDADLEMDLLETMKKFYEIKTIPSTMIDGKVFAGFHSKEELETVLDKKFGIA